MRTISALFHPDPDIFRPGPHFLVHHREASFQHLHDFILTRQPMPLFPELPSPSSLDCLVNILWSSTQHIVFSYPFSTEPRCCSVIHSIFYFQGISQINQCAITRKSSWPMDAHVICLSNHIKGNELHSLIKEKVFLLSSAGNKWGRKQLLLPASTILLT